MPWRYRPKPETITVDPVIRRRVTDLAQQHRVRAVRLLREETGLPLDFSVALVTAWADEEPSASPDAG